MQPKNNVRSVEKKLLDDLTKNFVPMNAEIILIINNRRILEELAPDGKTKVHKNKLNEKGFDFKHITHLYKTQKGSTYLYCYEYGYLPLENDYFLIICNDKENN